MDIKKDVTERFIRYVKIDTQSHESEGPEDSKKYPSTEKQKDLSRQLVKELQELGIKDAAMDEWGYVMGTLPSNVDNNPPVIGLISHVDTSPAASGKDVNPLFHKNYDGGIIKYPEADWQVLDPNKFPALKKKIGHTLITSNGDTLLGADDKAGVAEIMSTIAYLQANPDISHGDIKIGFTCDEEIGAGVDHFDIKKFGADYAYTVDGETMGTIEDETFCADSADLTIKGIEIHPGFAKDRLVNSVVIASEFVGMLPRNRAPETTEGREGYLHAYTIKGGVDKTQIKLIIRDFTEDGLKKLEQILIDNVKTLKEKYPQAEIDLKINEQYRNMKLYLEDKSEVIELALKAVEKAGLKPVKGIIRGGTDGSRLSAMGLPTPNIFTGGHNFHSTKEWISQDDMVVVVSVLSELCQIWSEQNK
ncbi:MAG: peptidase T [Deltaproteobacteria bacterium]|jgi:tripeptide aminopeptidase|nr:peptidase T [Deltaproteobacteria bacterium]